MKFGLGAPNNQKESDSKHSERSNLADSFKSPEGSPSRFTPTIAEMANNPNNPDQALQALQNQMNEMKSGFEAIVQQQNQTIANLANLATA
jgi:hypothetical protein